MRRLNKTGADMTIGTLVIIVLAIIVLVVVALGFGTGWSNLWSKMKSYFGGGVNVDDVKQACNYACTTKATYDYCSLKRNVVYEEAGKKTQLKDDKAMTCSELAGTSLGIEKCNDISCEGVEKSCKGTAVDCKDMTPLTKDNCEKQKTVDIANNQGKCKYDDSKKTCGLSQGDSILACDKLDLTTSTDKKADCEKQKSCSWI